MENINLKQSVKQIVKESRNKVASSTLLTCVVYSVLTTAVLFLSNFNIFALLLMLFLSPINHAFVVASNKVVRNGKDSLDGSVALSGVNKYKKILSTYITYDLITIAIGILVGVITGILIVMTIFNMISGISIENLLFDIIYSGTLSSSTISSLLNMLFLLLLITIIVSIVVVYIFSLFAFTPYILEKMNFKNLSAINTSIALTKGFRGYITRIYIAAYFKVIGVSVLLLILSGIIFFSFDAFILLILEQVLVMLVMFYYLNVEVSLKLAVLFDYIISKNQLDINELKETNLTEEITEEND